MALTNAEKQRLYIAQLQAAAAQAVTNPPVTNYGESLSSIDRAVIVDALERMFKDRRGAR
jgi:hypothetical protein